MKNNNPKFAFYYLLSLVALIFVAVSSAIIIFQIIDKNIIDALVDRAYVNNGSLRFSISALLVSAPIFFMMLKFINKGLRKNELEKNSSLRRWLTYFLLFVSAVIILGSLIGILNSFLSGEMTLKFVLKALTILFISAIVFSYYSYDIKREDVVKKDKILKIFSWTSIFLVCIVFVSALFFIESPKTARMKMLDQVVLDRIYSIESAVNGYYALNKELPESIDDILEHEKNVYFNKKNMVDPESGEAIEYKKTGDKQFEVCANFRADSDNQGRRAYYSDDKGFKAGYNCFKGVLWSESK